MGCPDAGWRRSDGGYAMPPERRKKCAWRRALIQGEVPVRKGVPAGGDIAAAGGSRWAVAGPGRLSLGRRLLCGGLDDGRLIRDTGGLSGQTGVARLSALRPESVTRAFRPSFPCPGRTYDKQKQVQGLLRHAGWVIRHGTVVTPAGWHRTTRAARYIRRRSRTSCIVNSDKG